MDFVVTRCGDALELKKRSNIEISCLSSNENEEQWSSFQGNKKLEELHTAVEGSGAHSVVVQGPSGCGKTSLLREYFSLCGRTVGDSVIVVHLGEQIDSKVLLGTFTCTAVPGEFVWMPGLLTKCVLNGHWIVLEDIDFAPPDVISLLLPLVKTGRLSLPGYYEPVVAAKGFKLFLTQRTTTTGCLEAGHMVAGLLRVLEDHSITMTLPPLTSDAIEKVICCQHPDLEGFSKQLAMTVVEQGLSLRQVLKLCNRIAPQVAHGRLTSVPDMMLDVLDCFCGHLSGEKKLSQALKLSHLCGGLSENMVEQLCFSHMPSLQRSPTTFSVGRSYIHGVCSSQAKECYSHTQSSLSLLEAVSKCVQMAEPVLLVGETGVGKTATVSYLARVTGHKLVAMNLSQQTDSIDLLGGYKPVQMIHIVAPLKEEFEELFRATFSLKQNAHFLASIQTCVTKQQWKKLLKLMVHSVESAQKRTKKANKSLRAKWGKLGLKLKKLRQQLLKSQTFAFTFDKGALVEAVSEGWWILLDEVNLASAETLQCLSAVLEADSDSLLFMEKPDSEPVTRHHDFRLFCCMNPSTDVGKKSLPENIRNRFTELYVEEPTSTADFSVMIQDYLKHDCPSHSLVEGIVRLYRSLKELSKTKLLGGTGRAPHYSLRNLCRALDYASNHRCGSFQRSLYEGFCMSFLTELCQDHHQIVVAEIVKRLSLSETVLTSVPGPPGGSQRGVVQVAGYWLPTGGENPVIDEKYILTPSVQRNLHNLSRVVSARKYPVLLQGPTSAGKTSLVQYLAKATGHHCLRINNHEHTDLQEYIGMYCADERGELVFQEGVLVEAMRKGYWIILDELNLAPTDVLEALNRVLDDNRELFIPETRKLVKAHPQFMLFGTQNPPGAYGGRKVLSRAFRNRFIELHYDDIPSGELMTILHETSYLPLSYAKKMVAVMKELQVRRTSSGVFSGKYGLITLRDLFRWAERYRRSPTTSHQFRDWEQQLAEDGFMLLAGRLRDVDDESVVLDVVQRHFKRKIEPVKLFGQDGGVGSLASQECLQLLHSPLPEEFKHLVWTSEFLRMAVLIFRALSFDEPVLLVGHTGCGKTTLCQLFSRVLGRKLVSINCHMHSEAADFLGGLKPTRSRGSCEDEKVGLFEWQDGVVVKAMQEGACLLVDEISLADDAVLERLNSVLETERCLLVSERSRSQGQTEVFQITASPGFTFMATMNPGGDYGKKELSPALRNRFVELWCPCSSQDEDLAKIIDHNLKSALNPGVVWSSLILSTIHWIRRKLPFDILQVSIRDLLTWVRFMNATSPPLSPAEAFYHGAHLVLLDGLGCRGQLNSSGRDNFLQEIQMFLQELLVTNGCQMSLNCSLASISCDGYLVGIHPFFVKKGPYECSGLQYYSLDAPGPRDNAYRLLRGMQVGKPLLIEGPPGVGKTSLVTALASYSGHHLARINLSEHTDVSDLFGCDLPVEGGRGVRFQWRDGPLLRALRRGDWVLLDEINLASQSVLEGLNAILDHRGEVFVPELGITFSVKPSTKLFACQNPMSQGGGRKGLPKSFLNRFTMVFVDVLSESDFQFISHSLYPDIDLSVLRKMISFNSKVEALVKRECGASLWEFNLRDILRWCQVMMDHQISDPGQLVDLIYCRRLRSAFLRAQVTGVYGEIFCENSHPLPTVLGGSFVVTEKFLQVGHAVLARRPYNCQVINGRVPLQALHCQLPILEAVMMCVERGWMTILVGGRVSGKTSIVRTLAQLVGQKLVEFPMNSDTDTTELLGGFQQVNFGRNFYNLVKMVEDVHVELLASVHHLKNGKEYSSKLVAMRNSSLPEVSGVLQEYSNVELLGFCAKLKECLEVLQELSSQLPTRLSYDVGEILSLVVQLMDRIQQGDSGGQFEWVDSVLVTALRYGHWLCITNCNVCNPSVLDRLNALVEPGGVLSIDERGVVGEEGVMTVAPHPNFRLFLLMDPAHGEISRAMRNRGIEVSILPEETLGSLTTNREDWRSLLSSTGVVKNSEAATDYLDSFEEDGLNPVRLLHGVYCSSMMSNRRVQSKWNYLDVPPLTVVYKSSGSELDLRTSSIFEEPDAVTVQNHFSVVLDVIKSHCSNEHCIMDVDAALEVFTNHASVSDYHLRKQLMTSLVSMCASDHYIAGVANAWCKRLQECSTTKALVKIERGNLVYDVPHIVSISNPIVTHLESKKLESLTLKENMVVLAARVTALKELLRWHSEYGLSALSVSYQAYTGQLQLESLIHPALLHIQPLLTIFIGHLSSTFLLADKDSNGLRGLVEWLAVIIHCFSHPVHSLTQLAGLWNVFKTQCISPSSAASKSELVSIITSLQPLENVVQNCCFFSEVRHNLFQSGNSAKYCNPGTSNSKQTKISSISCFKELSSENSVCTVGRYQYKVDQLKSLLSKLWATGCSFSNTPSVDLQQNLMLAKSLLGSTVTALGGALKVCELTEWCTGEQLPSESVSQLCSKAQRTCPDYGGPQFWRRVCSEISAAFSELSSVKKSLDIAFDDLGGNQDLHGELNRLCGLSRGCVYVGTVVTKLLLPTTIDPVSLEEVHYKCYQMLAAQQSAVFKACNRHYVTTTGKSLDDLMRARSSTDTVLPGMRGGVAPYVLSVVERKEVCEKMLNSMKPPVSSSSEREKYSQMVAVCTDVVYALCSSERVSSLLQDANVATPASVSRVETWSLALRAAVNKLHSEFPTLADVVKPFTTGLMQLVAGVTYLRSLRLSLLSPQFKILPVLRDSLQFPFATTESGSGSASFILRVLDLLEIISEDTSALKESERQQFHKRMLLIGVKLSKSIISHFSTTSRTAIISRRWYSLCSTLLKSCWLLWNKAEQTSRAKMEEESSLYRYRTKTHNIGSLEEGEVDDEMVRQIFPVYDEQFERLSEEEYSSKDETEMYSDADVQSICQFTFSEMREVFDIHQQVFRPQSQAQQHSFQHSEAMRTRYSFAADLAQYFDHLPGMATDYCLFGAHARMCNDVLTELTQELPQKQRNIYREGVVSEAVRVGPVVNGLKERVEELLLEWPDHPGLVQVQVSCDKVLSLSVEEPLMKILAGLEYVLRKSQDWEAYAASHVSLCPQLELLTQLILDWRRLELKSWRTLFEECSSDVQCEGSKWWFHIYSLCQESISSIHANIKDLIASVHEFVEVASLGEFMQRLSLLRAFGTDMFLQGHPYLGSVLVNTVNYYQQFAPSVTSHSSQLTSVIDKEINDHVRIMRWNDGNYWALKASTEKSHKTLVKFMRKLKGVLAEPVRPLLTAGALQTSDGDHSDDVDSKPWNRWQIMEVVLDLTVSQQSLLHCVSLETFVGSSDQQCHSQLTGAMALDRMKEMVCEYSSSPIYHQWNTTLNEFAGEVIETVKKLQSLEFLDKLEGDKRKSAIKLNKNQKRKAIVELFKYLKKQGLSRHGECDFSIELKCEIFQLPVIENQVAVEIPHQLTEDIQKYFYRCIGRLAGLQSAFVTPTKDLQPTQLKWCKGYAGHLMQLICSQRKTFSSATTSIATLQYLLCQIKSLVGGELYSLRVAEYTHWQSKVLAMAEMCLELVRDFKHIVDTLPESIDTSTAGAEVPPILSCGDRSIADRAVTMLQNKEPDLQTLYGHLLVKDKTHGDKNVIFVTRKDVLELADACSQIESFSSVIIDAVDLVLGSRNHRVAMFEFMGVARSYLITTCGKCREWIASSAEESSEREEELVVNEQRSECTREAQDSDSVRLLQSIVLAVQKVMQRHRKLALHMEQNEEELLEIPCCLYLHTTSTEGIKDMNPEKIVEDMTALLTATAVNMCEESMERLVPVLPLLNQYIALLGELVLHLALAHRTTCKLSSILLALFSDLVSKGVCAPPETEEVEGEGGTDFEAAEGGGFDEGQGAKNVSNEVDAENLVDPTKKSGEEEESSDQKGPDVERGGGEEDAVDMTQDFGGDVTDLPNEDEDGEEQDEDGEDFDKEMGELEGDNPEQIDRNMWVPEEQDGTEPQKSEETRGGSAESEEAQIVAQEGQPKPSKPESGQEPQPVGEESENEGKDRDPDSPVTQGNSERDQKMSDEYNHEIEDGDSSFDLDKIDPDAMKEEDQMSSGEEEVANTSDIEEKVDEVEESGQNSQEDEPSAMEEGNDQLQKSEVLAAQSLESIGQTGTEAVTSDEGLPPNSSHKEMQESTEVGNNSNKDQSHEEKAANGASTSLAANCTSQQKQLEERQLARRLHHRPQEDYSLAGPEESVAKRPRLVLEKPEGNLAPQERTESQMMQHMRDEGDMEHDAVVWDAAPSSGKVPPTELCDPSDLNEDMENTKIDAAEQAQQQRFTDNTVDTGQLCAPQESDSVAQEPMETEVEKEETESLPQTQPTLPEPHSFFVNTSLQLGQQGRVLDEHYLREGLMKDLKVLHANSKDVDAEKMWQRYEVLMSGLAQSLCEELRLALQPTQASQLKGDYRTGKRLNMRRIIPYIASYFQNDQIWLRRTKPSKREYQVLMAVDDSASMNENQCSQMAYESLAMISSALNRLECGQVGILRFGEIAELLHGFDEPFTVATGAHVLQQLSFSQTRTKFAEMLRVSNSLFTQSLQTRRSHSSPLTSQLLLILSDGRGVFADGTTVVEVALRNLNELGVVTVFVILDNLSKESVLNIKVPTFLPGKAPVIRSYLETFPFSFYIVLQDIKSLPMVLGKALQQWFQLLSGQ